MGDKSKLTANDYLTRPVPELVNHPDYSAHAFRVVQAIAVMTSEQLEKIDISKLGVRPRLHIPS